MGFHKTKGIWCRLLTPRVDCHLYVIRVIDMSYLVPGIAAKYVPMNFISYILFISNVIMSLMA